MKKSLLLLICLVSLTINAQEEVKSIVERINAVDYIFEGIVLETKPYKSQDEKTIYSSNLIEITKVFKGDLECGSVELITFGGRVGKNELRGEHSLSLEKGTKGVFLSSLTNKELSSVDFFSETNLEKLEGTFDFQSLVKYVEEGAIIKAIDMWGQFDSLSQLYNFTELVTGINYIDCNNSARLFFPKESIATAIQSNFIKYNNQEYIDLIAQADYQRDNFSRPQNSRSNNIISYRIENIKVTGSTPKYLEFDVSVKDNIGTKYLDQSAVRIKYPTLIFGNNVVGNNKIQVTRGTLNADPACYSNPVPTDRTNNVIFIPALESVFSQCKVKITTSFQSIMHIKMEMQICNDAGGPPSTFAIEDTVTPFIGGTLMSNYSAFAEFPNDTFQTYYDNIEANDVKNIPNCGANITDFYPKVLNGGVRDTLSVVGFQFGSARGAGNLFFVDANNAQASGLSTPLESTDYLLWSDTLIQVLIPSIDTGNVTNVVATGKFVIKTNSGEKDTSDQVLKVFYSLTNNRDSATGVKKAQYHFNNNNIGGQKFYIDTSISHNPQAYGCVKKALREWVCATGINFVIVGDTFGLQAIPTADGINLITFGPVQGNGRCFTSFADCGSSDVHLLYDFDIILSNINQWWYDSTGIQNVPQYKSDFYYVILHELGHAVGHMHINDPNAVMYYATPNSLVPGGLPAALRNVNLKNDGSAILGGKREVLISSLSSNVYGCSLQPMIPLPTCAGYTVIDVIKDKNTVVSVYPNPFNESFFIEADAPINKVSITTITGQVVFNTLYEDTNSKLQINIPNDLANSIYLLHITTDKGTSIKRLVHE